MNNTLCLCMIVKNESKIITRLLDSVINIIDYCCICDTGSTDNTIEIIVNYFKDKNIQGKIVQEPFKNFCYNRNFLLESAKGLGDYLLLLDADMILEIGNFNKNLLHNYDDYQIFQGNNYYYYYNKRIVKNNGLYRYYGVTHEYILNLEKSKGCSLKKDSLFIIDIGDGGSKANKFSRDIELLTQGLIDEPDNTRYMFYLGNSYYDTNSNIQAIKYYKQIINLKNGWEQEKYIGCIRIYEAYKRLGEEELGIHYLILSYKFVKNRIEGIYRLIKYYSKLELYEIAFNFYLLIENYFQNNFYNKNLLKCEDNIGLNLFCIQTEYKFYLPYFMIIISEKLKKYAIGIKMYEIIFSCDYTDIGEEYSNNLIYNLQFFINKIDKINKSFFIIYKNYTDKLITKYKIKNKYLLQKYNNYFGEYNNLITKKYIIMLDWLKEHVCSEQYYFCKKLEKYGWKIIYSNFVNIDKLKKNKCIVLCMTFDDINIQKFKSDNITLIYRIDDLYPYMNVRNECINSSNIIIGPYTYLFKDWSDKYKEIINKQSFYSPYSAIEDYYMDIEFNQYPINKIFVSGYVNNTYPLREKIINLSIKYNFIEIMPHPTYKLSEKTHKCIGKEYYKKLNNYLCCFTDSLCWNYILSKVFEITSVGSLLLVQDSIEIELNKLGFYNNINCIMCNESNIIEKIKWISDIKNIKKINQIRKNGMYFTRKNHSIEIRVNDFNNYIDKIIYINNNTIINNYPIVNSFDIFNTLITRDVEYPVKIFDLIEKNYPFKNFKNLRIKSESESNGSFDNIYLIFKNKTNLSNEDIEKLKNYEIETEFKHSIPIKSNINKIKKGDIYISDIYLPINIIKKLLSKHNIPLENEIFASPNGKYSGKIYEQILKKYNILTHCGDNQYSDIHMANLYNIHTLKTSIFKYTNFENELVKNSHIDLSNIFRNFRLENPFIENSINYLLYEEQAKYNIPILLYISVELHNILINENRNTLLLVTRDGCLLYKIFKYLYPQINCKIFHSSRIINLNFSENYENYIKEIYSHNNCLIFDMCGSFSSGRKLFLKVFGYLPRVHLFIKHSGKQFAEKYDNLSYNIELTRERKSMDRIETANNDLCGTLIKMVNNDFIRAPLEINIDLAIIQHTTCEKFINKYNQENENIIQKILSVNKNIWNNLINDFFDSNYILYSNKPIILLNDLAKKFNSKKKISYINNYELIIDYYKNKLLKTEIKLLEIGLNTDKQQNILNLQIFNDYFNKNILLYGFDINTDFLKFNNKFPNIKIYSGNQSNITDLSQLKNNTYTIIIDDGSNISKDQEITFKELWSYIQSEGCYIIENLKNKQLFLNWANNNFISSEFINLNEINNIKIFIDKICFYNKDEINSFVVIYKK